MTCLNDLIVHAGMPKTGTSSIQKTLWSIARGHGCSTHGSHPLASAYPTELGGWNHSHFFEGLTNGRESTRADKARAILQDILAKPIKTIIISAESLSNPASKWDKPRQLVRSLSRSSNRETNCVIYLRPIRSFIESHFVQRLKMGLPTDAAHLFTWPHYRRRVEAVSSLLFPCHDELSSDRSLQVRLFKKECLVDGDVVKDFFSVIGSSIQQSAIRRINESLSLEAVSLLYLDYLERRESGSPLLVSARRGGDMHNNLVRELAKIGARKFRLQSVEMDCLYQSNSRDAEWVHDNYSLDIDDYCGSADVESVISLNQLAETGRDSLGLLNCHLTEVLGYSRSIIPRLTLSERLLLSSCTKEVRTSKLDI